jgi:glucokinase
VLLGIDVRDTDIVAVVANDRGEVVARATGDRESTGDLAETAGALAATVGTVARSLGSHSPTHVGAAVDDPSNGIAASVVAAVAQAGLPAARIISRGSAVALAEQWCGAASGASHVVALIASDRVHAGVIIDGTLFEGAHGRAGFASWFALNPVEREDYRKVGCLEAEAGAGGIVRRFIWRVKAGDMSRAQDAVQGDLSKLTVSRILEAARAGDGVAISVVRDTSKYLGMTIGNLVSLLDPEVVVLGGLYADAADLLIETSTIEAGRRMSPRAAESVRVVAGTLGDQASAIGAARAAMIAR